MESNLVYPCRPSDVRSLANKAIVCNYLIKEECMHVHDCTYGKIVQEV